ncbi:MAG: putative DNA binding domain-containing protein [Candidatus Pacebacteria bacterium]|nr:putative DNA binding domain-containing protein [Candidatus Paceibacterota bacterium]
MELTEILNNIYKTTNKVELFDSFCNLELFMERHNSDIFFEERLSKEWSKHLVLKNDYTIGHIKNICKNQYFIKSVLSILKHQKDYKDFRLTSDKILEDGFFVNLSLNCCFYFITLFSNKLSQSTIDYIGSYFFGEIKKLEKYFSYEFNKIEILNVFENVVFNRRFFPKKDYNADINAQIFYGILKKSRLIVGHYLIDFSAPILLSNSFKKIVSVKKKVGDEFSLKDSVNRLKSVLKKYNSLSEGFKFDDLSVDEYKNISSFDYYFKTKESRKILSLINSVIAGLDNFSHDEILKIINNSEDILNKIKEFFYKNYNVFPKYDGSEIKEGQWSNKSVLNTIKFFAFLDTVRESNNDQWKIDIFLKCFSDWIDDLNENINYFSELDDYNEISSFLKLGENNLIEFKSTFGLPIQVCADEEAFTAAKKAIFEEIAKTILAMANSDGGDIFIGVVEKTEKIKDDIKPDIVERDGIYFLDIHFSFKKEGKNFDSKRLSLQQLLRNLTRERLDFLDSLFSFHFYKIFIEDKGSSIEILNIKVKKSKKIIFIKNDNWITLPKRLNGRVELVDPADEFQNKII